MKNETTHQHHPQTTSAYPETSTDLVADYDPASISADVLLVQESDNDRHNPPDNGNDVLLHQDTGRGGLLRTSEGFRGAGQDEGGEQGGMQPETGAGYGRECSASGHGRGGSGGSGVADLLSSCFPTQTDEVFKPEEHVEAIKAEMSPSSRWQVFRSSESYLPVTPFEAAVFVQNAVLHLWERSEAYPARRLLMDAHDRINADFFGGAQ